MPKFMLVASEDGSHTMVKPKMVNMELIKSETANTKDSLIILIS